MSTLNTKVFNGQDIKPKEIFISKLYRADARAGHGFLPEINDKKR